MCPRMSMDAVDDRGTLSCQKSQQEQWLGTLENHSDGVHGGAERDRTADLLVANEALSQLSYSPTPRLTQTRQPATFPSLAAHPPRAQIASV